MRRLVSSVFPIGSENRKQKEKGQANWCMSAIPKIWEMVASQMFKDDVWLQSIVPLKSSLEKGF